MKGKTKSTERSAAVAESHGELYSVLSAEPRRDALAVLLREGPELTESRLATAVAARGAGTSVADVPAGERREARVSCRHVHLQKLAEAGLIEWDREDGAIRLTREDSLRRSDLEPVLSGRTETGAEETSTTFALLANERRRVALTVLERVGPQDLGSLATRVLAREQVGRVTEARTERVAVSLKHVHLPRLVEAGVVEADGEQVGYRGNALLERFDLL